MSGTPFVYFATVSSAYDGDTVTLDMDLGFKIKHQIKCRLGGIDTPELRGGTVETKTAGKAARDHTRERVLGKRVLVHTKKDSKGKYGRYLAVIFPLDADGAPVSESLNDELIRLGHAKPYFGGKRS